MQSVNQNTFSRQASVADFNSPSLWGRLWETSPFLTVASLAHVALVAVALLGLALDPRLVLNEPAWIKPLKFAVSIAVYCATITWMVSFIQKPRWLAKIILFGTGFILSLESAWVVFQALRGVRSHFNFTTQFDAVSFQIMGLLIATLWFLNLILVVLLLVQRFERPILKWSLVWGLTIAILGGLTGIAMTEQETPAQRAALENGASSDFSGGHTFGAEDGGPGLPLVGWSTVAGDVRVAHFIGLHGLQVLPLLGLAIDRFLKYRLATGRRMGLLFIGGTAYLGVVAITFQQALRGYSIISFDPLSVVYGLALLSMLAISTWVVIRPIFTPILRQPSFRN